MSYTTKIKEEISQIKNTKSESIAELSGFLRNNATYSNGILTLTSENEETIKCIKNFFKDLYQLTIEEKIINNLNFSKKDLFCLTLNNIDSSVLNDLGFLNKNNEECNFFDVFFLCTVPCDFLSLMIFLLSFTAYRRQLANMILFAEQIQCRAYRASTGSSSRSASRQ